MPGQAPSLYRPCVGVMLLDAAGRVFVAQRLDTPGPYWQMPQGGIDEGEAPLDAARRELREETGVTETRLLAEAAEWRHYDLPAHLIGKLWGGRYRGQTQKWFLMAFEGTERSIHLDAETPEFSNWRWVEAEKLPGLAVPFKRAVYQSLLEEFAPLITQQATSGDS